MEPTVVVTQAMVQKAMSEWKIEGEKVPHPSEYPKDWHVKAGEYLFEQLQAQGQGRLAEKWRKNGGE